MVTDSSKASSSPLSRSALAATLAARWAGSPVPGMASTCAPRCSVQASRTCAAVAPCALAMGKHFRVLGAGHAAPAAPPGDGEERHEGDALIPAGVHELVLGGGGADAVPVLHADHGAMARASASCPGVTPETPRCRMSPAPRSSARAPKCSASDSVPAGCASSPRPGDRGRAGAGSPRPARVAGPAWPRAAIRLTDPAGPDLRDNDQVIGVRRQRRVDQLVGRS